MKPDRYQALLVSSSDSLSLWCLSHHLRYMVQFPNLKRIVNSRIVVHSFSHRQGAKAPKGAMSVLLCVRLCGESREV